MRSRQQTNRIGNGKRSVLHEKGLWVSAVNPLLPKMHGSNSLRNVHTDKADAKRLAKYALDTWSELREYNGMGEIRYNLKTLNKEKYNFSEEKAAEIYTAAQEIVVLVPMTELHRLMLQQAAQQLTAISCSVETYWAEMDKLASQLPEYPVVMEMFGVGYIRSIR